MASCEKSHYIYRVIVYMCPYVSVCMSVSLSVVQHNNSRTITHRIMKFEQNTACKNIYDEIDMSIVKRRSVHCMIFENVLHLPYRTLTHSGKKKSSLVVH